MFGEVPTSRTRVPVIKVRGGSSYEIRLRCDDVLGLTVHWLGRRSFVCPGEDCSACEQSVGGRWSGLVVVDFWRGPNSAAGFGLLELTEGAFSRLKFMRECEGHESFYGLCCNASRTRTRSPLRFDLPVEVVAFGEKRTSWAKERIADAAATLYGLPALAPGMSFAAWEESAAVAARRLVGRAVSSLDVPARSS